MNFSRNCPADWLDLEERGCFHFGHEAGGFVGLDWYESLDYCQHLGASLAEVHDDVTRDRLKAYSDTIGWNWNYWSGANDLQEVNTDLAAVPMSKMR